MTVHVGIEAEPVSGAGVVRQLVRLGPMLFMAGVLTGAGTAVAVMIGLAVVATGRVPQRLAAFQVLAIRQRVRTFSGFFLLRSSTPPWPGELSATDPGDDPVVTVTVDVPQVLPRWAPFAQAARAAVHLSVLVPVAIVLDLLYPAWIVLVATRGWSTQAQARLISLEQWTAEVLAHAWLVSADPPRQRWRELNRRSGTIASPLDRRTAAEVARVAPAIFPAKGRTIGTAP